MVQSCERPAERRASATSLRWHTWRDGDPISSVFIKVHMIGSHTVFGEFVLQTFRMCC